MPCDVPNRQRSHRLPAEMSPLGTSLQCFLPHQSYGTKNPQAILKTALCPRKTNDRG